MKLTKFKCVILLTVLPFLLSSVKLNNPEKPLYLVMYWHQHQPSYFDAEKGNLTGPWVRTHSTKDYYDMVSVIEKYPGVHLTVDLTSVLLSQIKDFYIDKLEPFINLSENSIDAEGFLKKNAGRTDPWIDLILTNAEDFTEEDLNYLFNKSGSQNWHCFSITEQIISRFPEYSGLIPEGMSVGNIRGRKKRDSFTADDKREIKFFFYLAYFDPRFLKGKVTLPINEKNGKDVYVDLTDLVDYSDNGTPDDDSDDKFTLRKKINETDCKRILIDTYKVMASVIPIHKKLMYDPDKGRGQIEIVTTPFYHPILPLLINTDIMKENRPSDPRPERFSYPMDADMQIKLGIKTFKDIFGRAPLGIWPSEGSLSTEALKLLAENGIKWAATGPHNLARSIGKRHPDELVPEELAAFYKVKTARDKQIGVIFRDLEISDDIAFNYGTNTAGENVDRFFETLEKYKKTDTGNDKVVTVLLDGENAWEFFRKDNDGAKFFELFYKRLQEEYDKGNIITVTPVEYIYGNKNRGIEPHPIEKLKELEKFHPGCWFSPDFTTWIGEDEENKAWNYLVDLRKSMDDAGILLPEPADFDKDTDFIKAWKEVFASEGSDWFWWYGNDQTSAGGGDVLFDKNYRIHLQSAYRLFKKAGYNIGVPSLPKIVQQEFRLPVKDFQDKINIDGRLDENSWKNSAGFFFDDDGGAQFSKNDYIKRIAYGTGKKKVYFGITSNFENFEHDFNTGRINLKIVLGNKSGVKKKYLYSVINEKNVITLSVSGGQKIILSGGNSVEGDFGIFENQIEIELPLDLIKNVEEYLFLLYDKEGNILDAAPDYKPLIYSEKKIPLVKVIFECGASKEEVKERIYIAGSTENLAAWIPNKLSLYDDGTHGDKKAGDSIWTAEFFFAEGAEVLYKFTNSGRQGVWSPGEEFSVENRRILVKDDGSGKMVVRNVFGKLE